MADPFIGEIQIYAFDYAPKGWAFCNGQLQPIQQNQALFALLGTTYGGDGRITFALPNLQGRAPIHAGSGPGLSNYAQGETGGVPSVTLQTNQIPAHSHTLAVTANTPGNQSTPLNNRLGVAPTGLGNVYGGSGGAGGSGALPAQGGQSHNNLQPYLTLSFCIALQGLFPSRT
jgi:microcystin-dependent protein